MLFMCCFLIGHKRKLETISCLAQLLFVILCAFVHSNQAAVIKKRDTALTATGSGNTDTDIKQTEQTVPTILTLALNNSSAIAANKSQTVATPTFATETSKELINNEVLTINSFKNATNFKVAKEDDNFENKSSAKQIEHFTFENKQQNIDETATIATETKFSNNDFKEVGKTHKLIETQHISSTQKEYNPSNHGNSSVLESAASELDKISKSPSRILTEHRTETETEKHVAKSKAPNTYIENSIDNSREDIKDEPKLNHKEKLEEEEEATTTLETLTDSSITLRRKENGVHAEISKTIANTPEAKEVESKTSASVAKVTENLQVLLMNTVEPLNGSDYRNQIKPLEYLTKPDTVLSQEGNSNKIHDSQKLLKLVKDQSRILNNTELSLTAGETTLKSVTNESDLLLYESNKKEHARSLLLQEATTTNYSEKDNKLLTPATNLKQAILSPKEYVERTSKEISDASIQHVNKTYLGNLNNIKEKKPKFINDNSTNAQQLNLPNNAEVWSLAAMKTLPKSNISIETAQTHYQTSKQSNENELRNISLPLDNNNSEKNLLDWSQIMMDKELSTTTRNDDYKRQETEKEIEKDNNDLESSVNTSTFTPEVEVITQFKMQPKEDVIIKNALIEHDLITSTMSSTPTSTTLSALYYNENNEENSDRLMENVEENKNNDSDTLTVSTLATNVDNNPFNTSLNIEPNLNEINLTSNQTQADLNNDVLHTITTAVNKVVDADVNANAYTEASAVAATTATTTKATAVFDMTTVEQISIETTTVSTLETFKQNALVNNVVTSHQQNINKLNNEVHVEPNSSLSASYKASDKPSNQEKDIDLNTEAITAIPITTFRPNILAITSPTSTPARFEQEVDENGNEFQINIMTTERQSITQTGLDYNYSTKAIETHLTEREFETTTPDTLTTTTAATKTATIATEPLAAKIENTLTSSLENDTTTTTPSSKINEINEITSATTTVTKTTQTTPKQVEEYNDKENEETTTGSSVSNEDKFVEATIPITTTEEAFTLNASTETPVVIDSEGRKELIKSIDPTIAAPIATTATTIATSTEQNVMPTTTAKEKSNTKENISSKKDAITETTTKAMSDIEEITETNTTSMPATTNKPEETYINLLDDTITTTQTYPSTISTTSTSQTPSQRTSTISTTSSSLSSPSSSSTEPPAVTTNMEEIYNVINSTRTDLIQTTTQQLLTEIEEESSFLNPSYTSPTAYFTEMLPPTTTTQSSQMIVTADIGKSLPTLTSIMSGNNGNIYTNNPDTPGETDVNVIIAITVSVIGVIALILLVGFLYIMRKRQKQTSYSQRCRPVSLDEYTIDNASVGGSMRKSSALRASKRTYGNLAFDDPSLRPNPLGVHELAKFVQEKLRIFEEFRDVPQITARLDEVPTGCEDKNRYANVLPLPETRVILQRLNDDEKSEYINANYITGPKDPPNYYIACQAPLESTVEDFWRMIWEQQSRVIIQATDLIENGVEKCAEYLPPSVTLDNHSTFGEFQITLQNREIKDKYAISTLLLKHMGENITRELTHYWYKWPEVGVPAEEAPIIAMLLEARSSLISYAIEQANEDKEKSSMATLKAAEDGILSTKDSTTLSKNNSSTVSVNGSSNEINGNISMVHIKKAARNQGPLTVHCSPGTGRTGTIIACDIAIRSLETPKRTVDIPQIVYYVRRGRASAVLTKEQYEFIYKVANIYAAKITNPSSYN